MSSGLVSTSRRFLAGMAFFIVTGPGVAGAQVSTDAQLKALQQEIAELRSRVQRLEQELSAGVAVNPARVVQPVAGGWHATHNWDLMEKGLSQQRVVEILGEAESSRRINKFEIWQYGEGTVKFYLGRVKSWERP